MPGPIKKILIANRGEIALRIIRAAKESGASAVAVYSAVDSGSLWVEQAAESYTLGDGSITDTYLNIAKIISLAKLSGADAIHPGYGFLSENYLFAQACEENNITFIGPSSGVLRLMGDKIASHNMVKQLGIAVPEKIICSTDEILAREETIDYPVLVKAAAGGGGKGMRLVNQPEELTALVAATSNEARNYFADDRIYLEKYFLAPRHIEVQLLGDKHGNIAHLFERECSIQRRHQKIIEEAPAASLSQRTREGIIQASLRIAREVNFYSAGTIEFLLDDNDNFYFLEMNPRIQVEHGVTEMITGIDIVKEQIAIAGGLPLSFALDDVKQTGHAIEARIFAEDPENNLLPSPGRIHFYRQPEMPDVRIDSSIRSGAVIAADYDPLIAKVIVHAESRELAIEKLEKALGEFIITGVRHNIPLLNLIVSNEEYFRNEVSTTFLNEKMPEFTVNLTLQRKSSDYGLLAVAAATRILSGQGKDAFGSPWQHGYWRNVRQIRFRNKGEIIELDYSPAGKNAIDFFLKDMKYTVTHIESDDFQIRFKMNDTTYLFYPSPGNDGILELSDGNLTFPVERFKLSGYSGNSPDLEFSDAGDGIIVAPLPGKVIQIMASEGDRVLKGDNLLVIESMKLENTILAIYSGSIQKIAIREGDFVKKNDPLIHIKQVINN